MDSRFDFEMFQAILYQFFDKYFKHLYFIALALVSSVIN